MSFFEGLNAKVRKFDWLDIGLIKLSVAAFILMVAKFWPEILGLNWYWYAVIVVLAAIRPAGKMWR